MTIKVKFSLLVSLLNIFTIIGVSFFILKGEKKIIIQEMKDKEIALIKGFAQVCKESYINQEEIALFNYIKTMKKTPAVEYLIFQDFKGKVIAHNNTDSLGKTLTDKISTKANTTNEILSQSYKYNKNQKIIDVSYPVVANQGRVGTVRIGFSDAILNRIIEETILKNKKKIIMISSIGILVGIIGTLLLVNMIIKPINLLASATKSIGEGKLNQTINIRTRDEIGQLANDFNNMSKKLKELDAMKRDFTSSVTHELKSPLTAIASSANYILTDNSSELSKGNIDFLITIQNNATRLSKFITNLLDVAKIESKHLDLFKEKIEITALLKEVVIFFSAYAKEKNLILQMRNCKEEIYVEADFEKIRQVLINLISNAMKFTPEGGRISIEANNQIADSKSQKQKEDFVKISVSDTGCGIPKDDLDKIFDKFYRVKLKELKGKKIKGVGLGLSIVKGIIEAHGGRIWAESEAGKGSTFTFILPKS